MGRFFVIFLLGIVLMGTIFYFGKKEETLTSPLSQTFGASTYDEIKNDWFPKTSRDKNTDKLNLSSKAVLLVDYDGGEVIYAKNASERLPAASTIKIMTALVALENAHLSTVFTISKNASSVGENSMGLTEGEKLSLEKLLYGLMLVSGNDAAVAIAEGVAQDEQQFVQMMNSKAKRLGISDTKFINASGLEEDGSEQYSSAYDMVTIARYIWENHPSFRKISETEHIYFESTLSHKAFDLYNDTNLLTSYPGVRGIKPGFTWEAGLCLVTYAENSGKRLVGVILGSGDRRGEMALLLDYGFGRFGIKVDHPGLDL